MPLSEKIKNFITNKNFQYVLIGLGAMLVTVSASYFSIGSNLKGAASLAPTITAPTDLSAQVSNGTITFSWTAIANDGPSTTYQFYRTTASSASSSDQPAGGRIGPLSSMQLDPSQITPYDPTANYNYYFTVSQLVNDHTVNSGPSNLVAVQSAQPATPTGLTATVTGQSVTLSWTALSGVDGYKIYRSLNKDNSTMVQNVSPATTTTYTDAAPAAGTTYYYAITSYRNSPASESPKSAYITAVTTASSTPVITPVSGFTCSGAVTGSKVTWTASMTSSAQTTVGTPAGYLWLETDSKGNQTKKAESTTGSTTIDYGTTTGTVSISPVALITEQQLFMGSSCSALITTTPTQQTLTTQASPTQPVLPSTAAISCSGQKTGSNSDYTVSWSATLKGVTDPTQFQYLWSGDATDAGSFDPNGYATVATVYHSTQTETKTANISALGAKNSKVTASCSVTTTITPASTGNSGGSSSGTSTNSQNNNVTVVPLSSGSTITPVTNSSSSSAPAALLPAEDVISCKMYGTMVVIDQNSTVKLLCTQSPNTVVNAGIYKGAFDPKNAASAVSVRSLFRDQSFPGTSFSVAWDGNSDFDSPVDDGDYTFVVWGARSANYEFDYSIFKLKVFNKTADATKVLGAAVSTSATTTVSETKVTSSQAPGGTGTKAPSADHASATDAYTNNVLPTQNANPYQAAPAVPSKCPGVNYPNDIAGHWAEAAIKKAYDVCLIKGFADGTFKPDEPISRFAALKTLMVGRGIKPANCYNDSCGTPFTDINIKQSQYVRQAWKMGLAQGVTPKQFDPSAPLTRAQGAALIAKFFKIKPFPANNCFTFNCGAGHPDNFFLDIVHPWQGPYIRAITDAGYMHGAAQNEFQPDRSMTRAEFIKSLFKTK